MNIKRSNWAIYLVCSIAVTWFFTFVSSCGKTTVLPAASSIEYQVINLSPDLNAVDLYIDNRKKNSASFYYPTPSGYFSVASVDTPYQIRAASTIVSTVNYLAIDTILKNNVNYTLFITGQSATNSVTYILTRDTSSAPTIGRGKIRFVNASPGSPPLDLTANGITAFTKRAYLSKSGFIELPAGNYDFKLMPTGTPTTILADLPGITVIDGKLLTLYSYGVIGRTDSAAFSMNVLHNN